MEMINQEEEEDEVDALSPAVHYPSQSRSLSRLSKMDTQRVRTTAFFQFCDFSINCLV